MVALHVRAGLHRAGPFATALAELPRLAAQSTVGLCVAQTVLVLAGAQPVPFLPFVAVVALYPPVACAARAAVRAAQRRGHRLRPRPAVVVAGGPGGGALAGVLGDHPEYGMRPVAVVVPSRDREVPEPGPRPDGAAAAPGAGDVATGRPAPVLPAVPAGRSELPAPAVRREPGRSVTSLPGAPGTTAAPGGPPRLSGGDLGAVATLLDGEQVLDAFVVRGPDEPEDPELLALCHRLGCTVWLVDVGPGRSTGTAARPATDPAGHLWGFACRRLDPPAATPGTVARIAKRCLDVTGAAALLLLTAPLLLGCAAAVRTVDGPGVLFRQQRIGQGGRPFVILKFRTLRPADDTEAATRWNVAGDNRMSGVGSTLRRTSLDELPQLWNVLRGDMSLVGPRPERPHFVSEFSRSHPGYARRHRMPAGLTGLAQVSGLRGDTSIEERARFDNHYIDTWSLWQDVSIMLRTSVGCFRCGGS
ncbi:sugar transferase [Streptomyces spiramenti]|uniref:Sugar transferase n=1 Tax=Streptomyces spiramenti TaxID=2720606 RepID=A0ABX1ATV8_9ACTN|nr:sugar transferase [Streptomyces spiramenti]NJP69051.1 sugar transferase [Streptomyces spiramenti]